MLTTTLMYSNLNSFVLSYYILFYWILLTHIYLTFMDYCNGSAKTVAAATQQT